MRRFSDKEILDWLACEGLESMVRVPQFDREGNSLHVHFWTSIGSKNGVYVSLRGAAMAAMQNVEEYDEEKSRV